MKKNDILQILRQFKESNAHRYKIVRLGLFGSGARDRLDKESDIDVVVVLSEVDAFN
jgi:predicted nucleotidyltransferase